MASDPHVRPKACGTALTMEGVERCVIWWQSES
jgi:hypothetical protein